MVPKGSPAGSAGGCLQRFVACVCDESHQERHGARCRETHEPLQPQTDCLLSPRYSSAFVARSSRRWRREMIKTPGAVRASQLIPRQAIGGERTSVTEKQSTICSGACCDENKGRRGRRGTRRGELVWLGTEGVVCGVTLGKELPRCFLYWNIYN